jgi:2-iminobutanoate/2-iminopropanoate deaminase
MADERRVVAVRAPSKGQQVAAASVIGNLIVASGIAGRDPRTGELGEGPDEQFELAFENMRVLVEAAGGATESIGHVTVFIPDQSHRTYINKPWLELFADPLDRPARKATQYPLPPGHHVQLQMLALAGTEREPLEISGLGHRDPIPMGARIGNLVFSSVIGGQGPSTGEQTEGTQEQVDQAFSNMRELIEQAGGTSDDIAHVWVFLRDREDQPAMIKSWLEMFPRDGDRPARKTIMYDELRGRTTLIQLQFTGVRGAGRRRNFEIAGVGHHDPIPMGARVGELLFSSGIGGYDPETGQRPDGLERQIELAFRNMRSLLEEAGTTSDQVALVTIMLRDYAHEAAVMKEWRSAFPDAESQPARHVMTLGLPGDNLVQLHVVAAVRDAGD